jgi:hypothetical protein
LKIESKLLKKTHTLFLLVKKKKKKKKKKKNKNKDKQMGGQPTTDKVKGGVTTPEATRPPSTMLRGGSEDFEGGYDRHP